MPLTAVAMATSFSSSTESSAPRLPSSVAACARCVSVTSGVAYQTVMPRPSWAGVLGMLRTIWRCFRTLVSALDVAPAMMLISSCPSRSAGASSRPTFASICGLIPSTTTSALRTASTFDSTAWTPCSRRRYSRRSSRGWLAMICSGPTSSPFSRPAIIASAMTPDPTVAMVQSRSDMRPRV